MKPNRKTTHGGARTGAGRKLMYDQKMIKVTVTLPPACVDALRDLGEGNVSLGIRKLSEPLFRKEPGAH